MYPCFCRFWSQFYKPKMLGPVDPYYDVNPPSAMIVRAGDVVVIDTRVMHCGGENCSDKDRMLFHFSFETTQEPSAPVGFTYNLHPELRGRHTLSSLSRALP
jgi:ectoine hydroxylase-related dioxygenase (phytanoyl-CoA dioxygenase family)